MKDRWQRSEHSVFNVGYHIIWCPKYRRKVLTGEVEIRLKELLLEKAKQIEVTIESMEVMPDHLHLFVKSVPTNAIHYIVQQLKGYTSRILRSEFGYLTTRLPTLWTRSYYCETIGHISENAIRRYIEEQKTR
jgi:putative transposase